jgi:hypothetical protein
MKSSYTINSMLSNFMGELLMYIQSLLQEHLSSLGTASPAFPPACATRQSYLLVTQDYRPTSRTESAYLRLPQWKFRINTTIGIVKYAQISTSNSSHSRPRQLRKMPREISDIKNVSRYRVVEIEELSR